MKKLFVVQHHHRHGVDVGIIRASTEPTLDQAIQALGLDFEEERDDEWIEITESTLVELP